MDEIPLSMNEISLTENRIAWRYWSPNHSVFYVSQLPSNGSDYGYTVRREGYPTRGEMLDKAIELTPRQQTRFAAHCRKVGTVARFQKP